MTSDILKSVPCTRNSWANVICVTLASFAREHKLSLPFASLLRTIWGVIILIMVPSVTLAQAWVVQPSVRLDGIYDDNFRLETEDPDEITTARISPAVEVSRRTETVDIAGLLRVDGNFYYGDDEGIDDQSNQLLDFSYFRLGELSRFGGVLSFQRDTLLRTIRSFEGAEDITVDPPDDVDEGIVEAANVDRQQIVLGPSWRRVLTERAEVGLSYEFTDTTLGDTEGLVVAQPEAGVDTGFSLTEYQTHQVNAELLTRVTEVDRLVLPFEYLRYDAKDLDRQYNNYDLRAGVAHEFSETTSALFTAGARYTEFDGADFGQEAGTSDTGFTALLSGTKIAGLTTFTGALERTTAPSVSGNLVETDQLALNVSRILSERFSFLLRSRFFETEAINELASGANRRFIAIQPRLHYDLSPAWALETAYEYRREKEFAETESADSNAVFLSLVWERPVEVEQPQPTYDLEDDFDPLDDSGAF